MVLGLFLTMGLTACGGSGVDEAKILEDKESTGGWALHGNFMLKDGTVNGWNGKENALYEASKMTATSLGDLKKADSKAFDAFVKAGVKYLYKYEGAQFGVNDAGWASKFWDAAKNEKCGANGSYTFKAVKLSYDAEEEVYAEDQWIHDPKTAHSECVTNNMFIPTWTEEKDAHGFSWADNPVVTGGAGVYTVYVAQYNNVSSADKAGYGIALIKTAEKEGQPYTGEFKPGEHTFGLVGSFNDWGGSADIALTGSNNGPYTATATLEANAEVKVRADSKWDNNWGYSIVDAEKSTNAVEEKEGGNILVKTAGKYLFSLTFSAGEPTLVITAALD